MSGTFFLLKEERARARTHKRLVSLTTILQLAPIKYNDWMLL